MHRAGRLLICAPLSSSSGVLFPDNFGVMDDFFDYSWPLRYYRPGSQESQVSAGIYELRGKLERIDRRNPGFLRHEASSGGPFPAAGLGRRVAHTHIIVTKRYSLLRWLPATFFSVLELLRIRIRITRVIVLLNFRVTLCMGCKS